MKNLRTIAHIASIVTVRDRGTKSCTKLLLRIEFGAAKISQSTGQPTKSSTFLQQGQQGKLKDAWPFSWQACRLTSWGTDILANCAILCARTVRNSQSRSVFGKTKGPEDAMITFVHQEGVFAHATEEWGRLLRQSPNNRNEE
jgi:hypothetical protein